MAGGRPNKYDSNVKPKLLLIEGWARNGLTEAQMCDNLDVSVASWCEYKKEYPELLEALKNGKEEIDTMVENALLKAAMGYEYEETSYDKDGNVTFSNTKYASPNTTALIFWLKNRRPKDWRDKQEFDHNVKANVKVSVSDLSDEELERLASDDTATG